MKWIKACLGVGVFFVITAANADEKLPVLKAGSEVYSNVTVTSVTATDIYFSHSGGMGNAKLKNLEPEMQKHFHFDPAKASAQEQKQSEATAQYEKNLYVQKLAPPPPTSFDNGDLVVREIYAKSFRGERPPKVIVDQWLTPSPPDPKGKFVMVFFWVTSAAQCRNEIERLNEFTAKFADRLVIIGLSNEKVEDMLKMTSPHVNFYAGTDTQSRSMLAFEVKAIPHLVLIDPSGIVRYEGIPKYLDDKQLQHLLDTYEKP